MFHLDPTDNNRWRLSVLIETPPGVRTITLEPGRWDRAHRTTPRLAMPYTIFAFHLTSTNQGRSWTFTDYDCFHSKATLSGDPDQSVIPAMLPNIYANGKICFGNTAPNLRANAGLADRLNAIVNEFYLTSFTDHAVRGGFIPWHGQRTYTRWVRETNANPRCWEDWPEFEDTDTTVGHFTVQQILSEGGMTPRITQITLPDGIPDLAFTPTFGRAHEWFAGLNGTQRRRLVTAIDMWRTENELDPATDDTVAPAPAEDDEDEE
jgi:hypothetical protein